MKVNFKKTHPDAVIPTRCSDGAAGYDLTAISVTTKPRIFIHEDDPDSKFEIGSQVVIDTGIAMEIPHGYVGYLFPRGSVSKTPLSLANSVGVIDSDYRGSVHVFFNSNADARNVEKSTGIYKVGERVAQLIIMPVPEIDFTEVDVLTDSVRGDGKLGSTGKETIHLNTTTEFSLPSDSISLAVCGTMNTLLKCKLRDLIHNSCTSVTPAYVEVNGRKLLYSVAIECTMTELDETKCFMEELSTMLFDVDKNSLELRVFDNLNKPNSELVTVFPIHCMITDIIDEGIMKLDINLKVIKNK